MINQASNASSLSLSFFSDDVNQTEKATGAADGIFFEIITCIIVSLHFNTCFCQSLSLKKLLYLLIINFIAIISFLGSKPFLQSDQDEQDSVDGETKALTESQEKAKSPPSGRPAPPQLKADKPPVPSLPVNTHDSQTEITEVCF